MIHSLFKMYRRNRKISIRELGSYLGVSIGYISEVENNKRSFPLNRKVIYKWAQFIGFPLEDLDLYIDMYIKDKRNIRRIVSLIKNDPDIKRHINEITLSMNLKELKQFFLNIK